MSITVLGTQEQAEEANRRAADWVKQHVAPLVAGPPEVVAVGEVRLRKGKQAEGEARSGFLSSRVCL